MSRRLLRRGLRLGAVVGAILFLIQVFLRNPAPKRDASGRTTPAPPARRPEPAAARGTTSRAATHNGAKEAPSSAAPAAKSAKAAAPAKPAKATRPAKSAKSAASPAPAGAVAPWVDPVDGQCPPTHPVKVKLASGIYHVPGGLAYDRTTPDRCYVDAAAAEADGFRPSKR